jgi:biotin synthase-like enzyme
LQPYSTGNKNHQDSRLRKNNKRKYRKHSTTIRKNRLMNKKQLRNDWTKEEIEEIYNLPLELIYKAATIHREWHNPEEVQMSTLLSIKTGGCPEDCSYCGQAARYHTNIKVQALLPTETVIAHAKKQKKEDHPVSVWLQHGEKFVTTVILTV